MIPFNVYLLDSTPYVRLTSMEENLEVIAVDGLEYADLLPAAYIITAEEEQGVLVKRDDVLFAKMLEISGGGDGVRLFYLFVCGQFMFILKEGQDFVVKENVLNSIDMSR